MAKEKSYLSGQLCYSVTHASVDPFLGEINIVKNNHSVNFCGISSRLRSDAPKSMMLVRREKENP